METEEQSIYGLFFEAQPKPGKRQAYFDHVDNLKPVLSEHKGLLWLHRYQSIDVPELILSHQYWASAAALVAWRRNQEHRYAQLQGMREIFADYRIRVGPRIWSWNGEDYEKELPRNLNFQQKCILTLRELNDNTVALNDESVNITGRYTSLTSKDQELIIFTCNSLSEGLLPKIVKSGARCADLFLLNRDYGLFNRSEAPLTDSEANV